MRHAMPVPNRAALIAALMVVTAGCGTTHPSPAFSAVTPPSGLEPSGPVSPFPGADGDRPDLAAARVALESVATGLEHPLFVTAAPDESGRLFIAEQGGRIQVMRGGALLGQPFLDLGDRVLAGGERGLLGLAFPPGFGARRPVFFVHYSDRSGDTTISEFRLSVGDPDRADPATERIILRQVQPYANHNGGWIGFDATGMLLIGLGDGGSGGDPENRASDLGTILGKMLRIDVLGAAGGEGYAIPADNPLVGRAGARPEILHWGLRNPFRSSVDPATGNLWIGDVGQGDWEEVDVATGDARGLDFGWRRWEGRHCFDQNAGCDAAGVTMPVTEYPHAGGCSVIGGVVYRGAGIPALRGAYLFSDYCSGTLWALDAGIGTAQAPIVLIETGRRISSIGTDEAGEVYLTDLGGGELLRLVPGR